MASVGLKPFSYVVLALIGNRGAGAHDIVSMMRRGRIYWAAAESQWYAEPKRLADLRYLVAQRTPGRTTERTHYRITAKGRRALRRGLAEPARFPRIQSEASIRLLAGDLLDEEVILASLTAMRAELDDLEAVLDHSEVVAEGIPERTRYLLLNHRLGRRLIGVHREWLDEVERELTGKDSGGAGPRASTRDPMMSTPQADGYRGGGPCGTPKKAFRKATEDQPGGPAGG